MKKSVSYLLILLLSSGLYSCGSDKDNDVISIEPSTNSSNPVTPGGTGSGDSWNQIDVEMNSVIRFNYRNTFSDHQRKTNRAIKPRIDRSRTIDINSSAWTPVSVGDLSYQISQNRQLPMERGIIVKQERFYFKRVNTFRNTSVRCAVFYNGNFTVMDINGNSMINNSRYNEYVVDSRPECNGINTMPDYIGLYRRDINEYNENYNVSSILSRMSDISAHRLDQGNDNRFFKFSGYMYDQELQQNLSHEFVIMLARGQYRVITVKKFLNGRLVDSAAIQYGFENRQDRLNYNQGQVRTWSWSIGF